MKVISAETIPQEVLENFWSQQQLIILQVVLDFSKRLNKLFQPLVHFINYWLKLSKLLTLVNFTNCWLKLAKHLALDFSQLYHLLFKGC